MKTPMMRTCVAVGILAGAVLGLITEDLAIWLPLGLVLGIAAGNFLSRRKG
jgi:uncharacterized membrane protein YoaK (UPF0700 family)